jgi:uncharacterized protein (TIGR03083 family)
VAASELLRHNDRRFCRVAADLSPTDWAAPSLCRGWTNHDVLAHLVIGYGSALGVVVEEMWRQRGSFDAANAELSRALAARRTPDELLDDFARLVERPSGMGRYFPRTLLLGDHVTHELDVVHALEREPSIAEDALIAVLEAQVSLPNPFVPAYRNSRGLRLHATDVCWTHGRRGPEVRGRAADLISVLGHRPRALQHLDGDGASVLTARLLSRPSRTAS